MGCRCEQRIGGVDGGECDAPVKFPWPSDVDALKARVGLQVEALDVSIKGCPSFSAGDRAAWEAFVTTWRTFAAKSTPTFGSYGEWVTACSFAHMVDAWRPKVEEQCRLFGPGPIPGADAAADNLKWMVGGLALVAVIGGGLYVARNFAGKRKR